MRALLKLRKVWPAKGDFSLRVAFFLSYLIERVPELSPATVFSCLSFSADTYRTSHARSFRVLNACYLFPCSLLLSFDE